jgi:hypothetical protein
MITLLKNKTMLKISLDEAYVFDLLSIYEVKMSMSTGEKRESLIKSYMLLSDEIKEQIGLDLFEQVTKSFTYMTLKDANLKVFKLVDRANETDLSKITAEANYERFLIKTELQTKFFKNQLTECKI